MKKYAILLSGGINYKYNYVRYQNDLNLAYRALTNTGQFTDDEITLLFADGLVSFDMGTIIPHAASTLNLNDCIEYAAKQLTENDEFVMVVSNHGGDDETICLWGREYITFHHLAQALNQIKAKKIIILGECFAGDFLKYPVNNACIFTANEPGKESFAHVKNVPDLMNYNFLYDEFLYHFFSFILGRYPDTRNHIPGGHNDLIAAYEYAKASDIFNPSNTRGRKVQSIAGNIVEIPQMKNLLNNQILSL